MMAFSLNKLLCNCTEYGKDCTFSLFCLSFLFIITIAIHSVIDNAINMKHPTETPIATATLEESSASKCT